MSTSCSALNLEGKLYLLLKLLLKKFEVSYIPEVY